MVVPSAYAVSTLQGLSSSLFKEKKIISAIKGILPEQNLLLNQFLKQEYNVELKNYFAVLSRRAGRPILDKIAFALSFLSPQPCANGRKVSLIAIFVAPY